MSNVWGPWKGGSPDSMLSLYISITFGNNSSTRLVQKTDVHGSNI